MESIEFNEAYTVLMDRPHDAFYILTPQVMERILRANKMLDHCLSLEFLPEGKVYFAIDSGHDFFEPTKIWSETDFAGARDRISDEIRIVTDLIDILELDKTML
jgi:hypothetical protein